MVGRTPTRTIPEPSRPLDEAPLRDHPGGRVKGCELVRMELRLDQEGHLLDLPEARVMSFSVGVACLVTTSIHPYHPAQVQFADSAPVDCHAVWPDSCHSRRPGTAPAVLRVE